MGRLTDTSLAWVFGGAKQSDEIDFMDFNRQDPGSKENSRYETFRGALQLFLDAQDMAKRDRYLALTKRQKHLAFRAQREAKWIYFLVSPDTGLCKIGVTADLSRRINTLRTSNSAEVELKAAVKFKPILEEWLHHSYRHLREHGEWFKYDDDLVDLVMGARVLCNFDFFEHAINIGALTRDQANIGVYEAGKPGSQYSNDKTFE